MLFVFLSVFFSSGILSERPSLLRRQTRIYDLDEATLARHVDARDFASTIVYVCTMVKKRRFRTPGEVITALKRGLRRAEFSFLSFL